MTVFEKSHRIGGLWPIEKIDDGLVNPEMIVNQSRHTVSFSDLAWPESTAQFPKAWEVGQYLEKYIDTYPGYQIRLNTVVIKIDLLNDSWKVHVQQQNSEAKDVEILSFDHVIVGTGFFGKPRVPPNIDSSKVTVVHSSQVRHIKDLLHSQGQSALKRGKRIVVVGGQMSGVETAAFIANQLSSETHSVNNSGIPDISDYYITNVVQRPFWVMPYFFPRNPDLDISSLEQVSLGSFLLHFSTDARQRINSAPNFLPLDLVSYNIAIRPPQPLTNKSGHVTPEAAGITHGFMKKITGTDQADYGAPELAVTGDAIAQPPYVTGSDHYCEYVRSGLIKVIKGKVTRTSTNGLPTVIVDNDGRLTELDDIAAIVYATGFDASPSIDFLPQKVLQDLDFEPASDRCLLALNIHSTVSMLYPSLGFVGFYRSPYWGVMEMQARYLGKLWSGDAKATEALAKDETKEALLKLRHNPRAAQFPMGDYAYLMESFAEILDIKRHEPEGTPEGTRTGVILPARYIPSDASTTQVKQSKSALTSIEKLFYESSFEAKFVSRAVVRGMQGVWNLERSIDSRRSDYPSGTLIGKAYFHSRAPTEEKYDVEYLYNESGEFISPQGFRFTATRRYVVTLPLQDHLCS